MQSLLVISSDEKLKKEFIQSFCQKYTISKFDVWNLEKSTSHAKSESTQAIGIEDIRKLQEKIHLKPVKSTTKASVIHVDEGITNEAQNALLKLLEEPPQNTTIIITASKKEIFLPTVISRCKIITLTQKSQELSETELNQKLHLILSLPSQTLGEKMVMAEKTAKSKEHAQKWLEEALIALHTELYNKVQEKNINEQYIKKTTAIANKYQKILTRIQTTNVNLRLNLEHLFLHS